MAQQKALYLKEKQGAWEVGTKEVQKPGPGELLIKIAATALNPVDWKIQKYGMVVQNYPAILGTDAAGTVEAVGEGVTSFANGDRVLHQGFFSNDKATFQQYTIVPAEITAKLPASISFDQGASVPLGLATAAIGLYGPAEGSVGAGLTPPWEESGRGKYAGKPILIFGGATSVGQYAIQLAKLSGFSPIIVTASPKHTQFLNSLGANHVLDRNAPLTALESSVAPLLTSQLEVVYDAVSFADTQQAGYDLLAPSGTIVLVLDSQIKDKSLGKKQVHVMGNVHVPAARKTGVSLYSKLTSLLESGELKPNRVEVLPNGLAGIPDGLKRMENDQVSGVKLIARPQETA
ncbi:GroES-like protein [Gloeophyllum trabeum ATCC 11539]|uniref:GroES-like protein n=1 Tax=Gloeophyllum trabeum (strain ATCC 11539 / FP-39264 / Madison 617) TaxID=670483 RepID=S7RIY3_GLOTA|nr:GroES-like protein [Gloeophyllum trabeum ATCC 11539]EPQ52564.1 GroES-like protein [Gloeophyllum trabeum ATCC 11539]